MATKAEPASRPTFSVGRLIPRPGKAWLSIPVTLYLLTLLVLPVVLIALYSVGLLTNTVYPPVEYSWDNWKDFLPNNWLSWETYAPLRDTGSIFFDRFKVSMMITLLVSVSA